jgi:hypothetical protein
MLAADDPARTYLDRFKAAGSQLAVDHRVRQTECAGGLGDRIGQLLAVLPRMCFCWLAVRLGNSVGQAGSGIGRLGDDNGAPRAGDDQDYGFSAELGAYGLRDDVRGAAWIVDRHDGTQCHRAQADYGGASIRCSARCAARNHQAPPAWKTPTPATSTASRPPSAATPCKA